MIPADPNMLFCYINTGLRDKYEDLEDMASSEGFDVREITDRLEAAGFRYDSSAGKFIAGGSKEP
ncbi:MAG: DUF4250 domain-containing protein [Lachnospiraceae bacterium]|nr:DUF4250 domain-containing protein [Lachnospiraceae bacterium]